MAADDSRDAGLLATDKSQLSPSAQQIRNCGELICRCSSIVAAIVIFIAGAGSAYIDESRLLTFMFFGIAPAILIYMTGFSLRLIFMWLGAIYDVIHPYLQKGCLFVSKTSITGLHLLYDAVAKLNLYENLIPRPKYLVLETAKIAAAYCIISSSTIGRLKRLRRDAYRNFIYISMFPVRQSAQLLIRILGQKTIDLDRRYPACYPSAGTR
jgi:hypothetical protein